MKKIVFICTGNTCRSPMAEGLFRALLHEKGIEEWEVSSAGLASLHHEKASRNAVKALAEMGIDIAGRHAEAFRPDNYKSYDFFVPMTPDHEKILLSMGIPTEKIILLSETGITDPYGKTLESYCMCRDEISAALKDVLQKIQQPEV